MNWESPRAAQKSPDCDYWGRGGGGRSVCVWDVASAWSCRDSDSVPNTYHFIWLINLVSASFCLRICKIWVASFVGEDED